MTDHPSDPLATRASRRLAALALAAALCWPAAAQASMKSFSAGSLIIPASVEYQTDNGVLGTYSIVYITLWKNADRIAAGLKPITFYWAVEPNKLSQYRCNTMTSDLPSYGPTFNDNDGCDFAVQNAGGQPVDLIDSSGADVLPFNVNNIQYTPATGPTRLATTHAIDSTTKVVKYLGGAWIVDSTDRQAFLNMLANTPELASFHKNGTLFPTYVNIHSARAAFNAPVASYLTQKPPTFAVLGSNQYTFLMDVLNNAGICPAIGAACTTVNGTQYCGCGGTFPTGGGAFTSGIVYDYYANPSDLLSQAPGYPNGRLNGTVNNQSYGAAWASDQSWAAAIPTDQGGNLATFLSSKGNTFFAEYDSVINAENGKLFQTTAGVAQVTPQSQVNTYEDCNDSATPSAVSFFRGDGGNCLVYAGQNQPYAQTGNFLYAGGTGSYKGYTSSNSAFRTGVTQVLKVQNGVDNPTVASVIYKDNSTSEGLIVYLAGHKFDNPPRYWGERLILNLLFSRLNPLTGIELARSEPVGYLSPVANSTAKAYQGTYVQPLLPDSNDVVTYNPSQPQVWQFPYTVGHLYEYDVASISSTAQTFSQHKNWDAGTTGTQAVMPLPGNRNIFTVVGGSSNLGWRKIPFDYTQTNGSTCLKDSNGLCYLSELLAATNSAGYTTAALTAEGTSANGPIANAFGMLVQQARGFCSAHTPAITGTPIFSPTDAQCDCVQSGVNCGTQQGNRALLGGIDHSSPAVVGPSRYLTGAPWSTRPVVAYAAGHDGMLHAFYVGSGGAASWTADGQSLPAGVQPGQELWAFLPPGQVGNLATNFALVDGSINVIDAFGDFPYDKNNDGVIDWSPCSDLNATNCERPNHVRRWRTVLIASAASGGSELFALDVTNPLKPVLLWDLRGPVDDTAKFDLNSDGVFNVGEVFDPAVQSSWALKWFDWDDGVSSTTWIPTDYNTIDATVISHLQSGRYDYRNLGYTYSTSVAKVWVGDAYQYLAFTATNAVDFTASAPLGYRGVEVFAVDILTGQKVWQWEHLYASTDGSGIDNGIPPGVALGDIDANGSTDRIYVGDMEGHLWELAARDGRNINYLPVKSGQTCSSGFTTCSFPLYGTPQLTGGSGTVVADAATRRLYTVAGGGLGQQPLTTPIGEGRFTVVPPAATGTNAFTPWMIMNRLALVVGTMGVDWAIAPYEPGNLFVLPAYPDMGTRLSTPIDLSAARNPLLYGVLLPQAVWQIQLGVGERVYGMPRVANNNIVFNTAFGSFTGDISSSMADPGNLWIVKGATQSVATNGSKSFGGALIVGDTLVVTTDTSIRKVAETTGTLTGGAAAQSTFNRLTPAIVKTWEPLR